MPETRDDRYRRERDELAKRGWYVDVTDAGPGWHTAGELCQYTQAGESWWELTSRVLDYAKDRDTNENDRKFRNLAYLAACSQFCYECPWIALCNGHKRASEACLETMMRGASIGSNVEPTRREAMAERSVADFCKAHVPDGTVEA